MLKIYGRANSINVRKVLWLADELGLAYIREDWGRGFRNLDDPAFKAVSPMQAIPVVDDDGMILRESHVILRYLADKAKRADLYPTDLQTRANVDTWLDWAGTDLYWGVRLVFMGLVVKQGHMADPAATGIGIKEATYRMKLLDGFLAANGPFLAGDTFTIADIPTGLIVNRWFSIDFEKPPLPAVTTYYERLSARPAFMMHGRNGTP